MSGFMEAEIHINMCRHTHTLKICCMISLLEMECDLNDCEERKRVGIEKAYEKVRKSVKKKFISALWEYYPYRSQTQRLRYVKPIINVKILQH